MVYRAGSRSPHSPAFGSRLYVSLAEEAPFSEPHSVLRTIGDIYQPHICWEVSENIHGGQVAQ